MTGAPDAAGELARRGLVRRLDLRAMGVPVADLDALGPATAGWLIAPEVAVERAAALADALAAHDAADPVDPGLPRRGRPPRRGPARHRGSSSRCCGSPSAPTSWCATAG